MSAFRLNQDAIDDLTEIYEFIAKDSPNAAAKVLEGLWSKFELLARFPRLGPIRDDWEGGRVRSLVDGRYHIVYQLDGDDAVIIAGVIHGARDISAVLGERPLF